MRETKRRERERDAGQNGWISRHRYLISETCIVLLVPVGIFISKLGRLAMRLAATEFTITTIRVFDDRCIYIC